MLRAEAVTDAPPAAERGDWLYGSAGFTEPDEYGWMAPAPPADIWVPRALVLWRMAILSDVPVSDEQVRNPRHSLARWPAIEAAVRCKVGVERLTTWGARSEEHTSELQYLMRNSYAVFCLKKK